MRISDEAIARMVATRKARGNYACTEEQKLRISASLKGRKKPPRTAEHSMKISIALRGKKLTTERRQRCAEVLREAHKSEKWLASTRAYAESRRGVPRKPETIMKMSATRKARGNYVVPQHVRDLVGHISRNRVRTVEEREKIAAALRGRKRDPAIGQKAGKTRIARRTKPYPEKRQRDPRYYPWRRAVLKRDEYACRMCGLVNRGNHAHHIKSWNDAPELRYEVENAITLCISCHVRHHHEERRKGRANGLTL